MRVPNDHPLARTLALRDSERAAGAVAHFAENTEPAALEALCELVLNPDAPAKAVSAALFSLRHDVSALTSDTVVRALHSQFPSVRIQACGEVERRELFAAARPGLVRLLETDPFWQVRRAAIFALARGGMWDALAPAAHDPHWRVRYALAQALLRTEPHVGEGLLANEACPRTLRLRDFVRFRRSGDAPSERADTDPHSWCPFWDWDPAVLARNLELLGRAGRHEHLNVLTRLVNHPDERVRGWVIAALRDDGSAEQWADALARLGDPREDAAPVLEALTVGIELERIEEVAKFVLRLDSPPLPALRWAAAQAGLAFPVEGPVADDLARHAPRLPAASDNALSPFPEWHPHARAASLTPERAMELVDDPTRETSWFVLARAAKLCRVPVWKLYPESEWTPPAEPRDAEPQLSLPRIDLVRPVQLGGASGPVVSPLGISGHYGLPVEGYSRAAECGVNLFFWEPNYATLARFVNRLAPTDRRGIHLLAGTFEADPARIRKDVERALRNLKIERLSVFLIFWTQSWRRVTLDVREELERLKADGLVQVFGLSTHNRALARDAIRDGWNPVMVRHSAAHRKAETEVFSHALERGTSILTFNNTCYGRLLHDTFQASDCFRYTLNTPGVSACFTAPSTLEQLEENLLALRDPHLPENRRAALLARGEWMYREDTVFRKTVRAEV